MTEANNDQRPSEFIALAAFLMATTAFSLDMILPSLGHIAQDLQLKSELQVSWLIMAVFCGLMFGQLFFGPLSDAFGRRLAIQAGIAIFLAGTFVCIFAESFEVLVAGRLLQGFGGAATRIVTQAMIRDRFQGREMARVMSFIMTIFILVPIFAPLIGQIILWFGHWHLVFVALGFFSTLILIWFSCRQPETLAKKHAISPSHLTNAFLEVIKHRKTMRFAVASGINFGALVIYLSHAQHIFQNIYGAGEWFPVLFGLSAASIVVSSLVNARYVRKLGMETICRFAFGAQIFWSACFSLSFMLGIDLDLNAWLLFITMVLFFMGLTFGNLQSVAMEPMGAIAGTASTMIGSLMTGISLTVGITFSQFMAGSTGPLIVTFFLTGLTALLLISTNDASQPTS